jgi:hypothetical protein
VRDADSATGAQRYDLGEHAGIKVVVRLVELPADEGGRLRERQLRALVRLLRRAAKKERCYDRAG